LLATSTLRLATARSTALFTRTSSCLLCTSVPSAYFISLSSSLYGSYGNLNLTHQIDKLTFGSDFPGSFETLNGKYRAATGGNTQFQYFLKVIPTSYVDLKGRPTDTNQYSVTEHDTNLGLKADQGMPGALKRS
jgi:hypothetical protein